MIGTPPSEYHLNSSPIKCLALCKVLEGLVSTHCRGADGGGSGVDGVEDEDGDEDKHEDDVGSCP
jgi:hypothetical protein